MGFASLALQRWRLLATGGLMSSGPEFDESCRRAAALVDAILKGALPANLPVEEPTRFTHAVNLKTAVPIQNGGFEHVRVL